MHNSASLQGLCTKELFPFQDIFTLRIALRAPNWMGDAILSRVIIRYLRRHLPQARLDVWSRPSVRPLFDDLRADDAGVQWFSLPNGGGLGPMRRVWRTLRQTPPQAVLLLAPSLRAALEFRGAGVPIRIGFPDDHRRLLLTHPQERRGTRHPRSRVPFRRHIVEEWLDLADALIHLLGASPLKPARSVQRIGAFPAAKKRREDALRFRIALGGSPHRPSLAVFPFTRGGPPRSWPLVRFAHVIRLLLQKTKTDITVFATPNDGNAIEPLRREFQNRITFFAGRSALSLKDLIRIAPAFDAALTNDSGPMHLMSALSIPHVALFGATLPALTGPYWGHARILHDAPPDCAGCYTRSCPLQTQCLTNISPELVFETLLTLLDHA